MNAASAYLARNARPSAESPACSSTGWPCGARGSVPDPANVELRAVVLDHTNSAGVDVDSALPVGDHGVGRPAVPELARHGDELLGPLIAVGVVEKPAAAEVLAGERVRRGDHVPAGAAVGQMVEGGELPCHFEGFVERGVDGARQAEAVGDGGQRGQHGERVGSADDVEVVDAAAVLPQSQALGEEEEVEQAALGGLRQVRRRSRTRSGCPTRDPTTPWCC